MSLEMSDHEVTVSTVRVSPGGALWNRARLTITNDQGRTVVIPGWVGQRVDEAGRSKHPMGGVVYAATKNEILQAFTPLDNTLQLLSKNRKARLTGAQCPPGWGPLWDIPHLLSKAPAAGVELQDGDA